MKQGVRKTKSEFFKRNIAFISHPIVSILIGIFITWAFFFFVERKEVDLLYSVSRINSIANQSTDAPDLKIFWKDKQVKNLKSVEIAFWNSGKQFLDKNNISDDDPIQIKVPRGIEVLKVEILQTSRAELYFDYAYSPSNEDRKTIVFNIIGDEVLEKSDGVLIKVYFTGIPEEDFVLSGRVFGNKYGFRKIPWVQGEGMIYFSYIILFTMPPYIIYLLFTHIRSFVESFKATSPIRRIGNLIGLVIMIAIVLIVMIPIYTDNFSVDLLPAWISL